jgi:hypothetical protein
MWEHHETVASKCTLYQWDMVVAVPAVSHCYLPWTTAAVVLCINGVQGVSLSVQTQTQRMHVL